jgi:DNA primase
MNVATVVLPDGKDPADVALESGVEVKKYFDQPVSLVSLLLQQLQREGDAAGKEQQLQAMLPLLKMIPNPIVQGKMVQEVAAALHVTEQQVHKVLSVAVGLSLATPTAEEPVGKQNRQALPEWDLLGFLLMYPTIRQEWLPKLTGDFFTDSRAGALFMTLTALTEQQEDFLEADIAQVVSRLPADMQSFAQGLVALAEEFLTLGGEEVAKEADLLYSRLQRRALMSRLNILQETLSSSSGDERLEVLRQFQTVTQELSAISHF